MSAKQFMDRDDRGTGGQYSRCSSARKSFRRIRIGVALASVLGALSTSWSSGAFARHEDPPRIPSVIVETKQGRIQGFISSGVIEFLGVPYAEPPTGNLRWQPPKDHASWATVLQTTEYAPVCALTTTLGVFSGPRNNNEDCLYLNIFTPRIHPSALLPVIVYIHGGGNYDGETPGLDGSKLASQGNTVVVTVEYRLNLMGFLAHPALDNEGHLFGNYGILDQQAALKWVQSNIAAFGGNDNNVTLAGQSSGSIDTMINLVSPLAAGLFQRAICQSACPAVFPLTTKAAAEATGVAFAKAAGCGSGDGPDVAQCLRDLPADRIEELAGSSNSISQLVIASGIVDGQIVPDQPLKLFMDGRFNRVPVMNGATKDEINFILAITEYWSNSDNALRTPPTAEQYVNYVDSSFVPPTYSEGTAAKALNLYPLSAFTTPQLAWNRVATDSRICNVRHLDQVLATQTSLYAYEFTDVSAPSYFPDMPGMELQAYHTADIQYLFPLWHGGPKGIQRQLTRDQRRLSDQMVSAWANFARTGNPNGLGNSPWPRYTIGEDSPAWLLEGPPRLSTLTDQQYSSLHHCDFWDSASAASPPP